MSIAWQNDMYMHRTVSITHLHERIQILRNISNTVPRYSESITGSNFKCHLRIAGSNMRFREVDTYSCEKSLRAIILYKVLLSVVARNSFVTEFPK